MKRTRPATPALTSPPLELAVCFYDEANDYPNENFDQIAKRVVPRGFGKSKTSAAFRKEARRMSNSLLKKASEHAIANAMKNSSSPKSNKKRDSMSQRTSN
jgi:hypothetical protein